MSAPEEWRPVACAPSYEVSSLGRVRRAAGSLYRSGESRLIKPRLTNRGYQIVDITIDGKSVSKTVHRLVCEAFNGPSLGRHVDHVNGIKADNRPENLDWVTPSENMRRSYTNGTRPPQRRAA